MIRFFSFGCFGVGSVSKFEDCCVVGVVMVLIFGKGSSGDFVLETQRVLFVGSVAKDSVV